MAPWSAPTRTRRSARAGCAPAVAVSLLLALLPLSLFLGELLMLALSLVLLSLGELLLLAPLLALLFPEELLQLAPLLLFVLETLLVLFRPLWFALPGACEPF